MPSAPPDLIDPYSDDTQAAVQKVEALSHSILLLREKIQGILEIALRLRTAWHDLDDLSDDAKKFADQLIDESTAWTSELANRYTFLLNLNEWLSLRVAPTDEQHPDGPDSA